MSDRIDMLIEKHKRDKDAVWSTVNEICEHLSELTRLNKDLEEQRDFMRDSGIALSKAEVDEKEDKQNAE